MTLRVEWVYQDTGDELTAGGLTTSITNPNAMQYDGRYMWLACDSGIAIYEFWGSASDNEPTWDTLDELIYPKYNEAYGTNKKLKLITFISISASQIKRATRYASLSLRPDVTSTTPDGTVTVDSTTVQLTTKTNNTKVFTETSTNTIGIALVPKFLAKIAGKIYAAGASFEQIFEFDIATQRFVQTINLPIRTTGIRQIGNSNIAAAGGKLWFVNTFFNDTTPQRLYSYTPGDSTMAFTNIPNRPSTTQQYLADGKNGYVYLANFNDVSVGKYATSNGAYSMNIRVNAFPTGIWSDENRRIFVNSFAGMLSLVDWDDNEVHNNWSTDDPALSFAVDTGDSTKVWWVDGEKIVRHNLNNKTQLETGTTEDWGFNGTGLTGAPKVMQVTYPQTYGTTAGDVSILPYVFVAYSGKLTVFRLDTYWLYRPSYVEVNGQGAVVAGPEEYFGEV